MGSSKKEETACVFNTGSLEDIKLYKRRWMLLALFMYSTSNFAIHWMQFSSLTNIVSRYYDVSPILVEWTAMMNMASRAFVLVPSLFLIDKLVSCHCSVQYVSVKMTMLKESK